MHIRLPVRLNRAHLSSDRGHFSSYNGVLESRKKSEPTEVCNGW